MQQEIIGEFQEYVCYLAWGRGSSKVLVLEGAYLPYAHRKPDANNTKMIFISKFHSVHDNCVYVNSQRPTEMIFVVLERAQRHESCVCVRYGVRRFATIVGHVMLGTP